MLRVILVILFMLLCLVASGWLMISCAKDIATSASNSITYGGYQ